jgi:hypothetical protein
VAEQHRTEMRVGVLPVAVRVVRIVVHPAGIAGDELFEERLDVGQQGRLELVDEHAAGRVQRPEADHPLLHAHAADERHDALGEVDQLDALVGLDEDGFTGIVGRLSQSRPRRWASRGQ